MGKEANTTRSRRDQKPSGRIKQSSVERMKRTVPPAGACAPALPISYIDFKLSTLMVSPSILPVMVTFFPATSFTLSCSLI